jgi:hypothetical protein
MQLEGLSGDTSSIGQRESRDDAIMNVLRPDQRQQYDEVRAKRRAEEEARLNEVGLKLPATWDVFEDRM